MLLLFQIYRSNIITPNCYTSEAAPGSWRPPETGEMETQHRTIIGYCTGASSFYTCYLTILTCPWTRKLPIPGHKGFLRWANTIVSCCMVPSAILWQAAVWGEEENDEIKSVMPHIHPGSSAATANILWARLKYWQPPLDSQMSYSVDIWNSLLDELRVETFATRFSAVQGNVSVSIAPAACLRDAAALQLTLSGRAALCTSLHRHNHPLSSLSLVMVHFRSLGFK